MRLDYFRPTANRIVLLLCLSGLCHQATWAQTQPAPRTFTGVITDEQNRTLRGCYAELPGESIW